MYLVTGNVGCTVLLIGHTLARVGETPSIMFDSEIWLQSRIWIRFWMSRRLTVGMTTTRVWSFQCRFLLTSCVVTKFVFAAVSYWSVSQSIFNSNFCFKKRLSQFFFLCCWLQLLYPLHLWNVKFSVVSIGVRFESHICFMFCWPCSLT